MTTITIELCAEDRARLDAILTALTANAHETPTAAPERAHEEEKPEVEEVTTPKAEEPAEAESEAPAAPETHVTAEEVQRKVRQLLQQPDKRADVKALVLSYAERVSAIPEDKLAEVWDKLTAMEG